MSEAQSSSPASAPASSPAIAPSGASGAGVVAASIPVKPPERLVYQASGLRKLLLCFAFMLLVPFFVSLFPMLFQRLSRGLWGDAAGLVTIAVPFAALMVLVLFELMVSLRSRVELGDRAVRFTLPARGGLVPAFSYVTQEIPYDQIASVEMRREIYGGALAPVLLRGARIITKDGQKLPLGYVSEANLDAVIPFPQIAENICARINATPTDAGNVRRSVRRKFMKLRALDDGTAISQDDIAMLNSRHNRAVLLLIGGMFLLMVIGLALDGFSNEIDRGERAVNATVPALPGTAKR